MVSQLFNSPTSDLTRKLGIINSTIAMTVLAIGATMEEDCSWAETLAEKAKTMASAFDHVVNLQAVQVVLLLICLPFPAGQIESFADIQGLDFTPTLSLYLAAQILHISTWEQLYAKRSQQVCTVRHRARIQIATRLYSNREPRFGVFTFTRRCVTFSACQIFVGAATSNHFNTV